MDSNSCNQCEALMINGIYCHETGCPNRMEPVRPTEKWMMENTEDQ
jgi:hypothetical protein